MKKIKRQSTYDKIFDRYFTKDIKKSGTKYEVLACMVFQAMNVSGKVMHDLKLSGDSQVQHQIDLVYEGDGGLKRVLVECKDFDISNKRVGLGIVRDFSAVVQDIKPDEAFIITCKGFTKPARKFAKHHNIRLAVLREFSDEDKKGRVQKITFEIHAHSVTSPHVQIVMDETSNKKFQIDLKSESITSQRFHELQPLYLNTPQGRFQFNDYVGKILNEHHRENEGAVILKHKLENSTIEVASRGTIPIVGLILTFEVIHDMEIHEIIPDKIAELILVGFQNKDIIIFDQDIRRYEIDGNTGEIIPNNGSKFTHYEKC